MMLLPMILIDTERGDGDMNKFALSRHSVTLGPCMLLALWLILTLTYS